MSSSNNGHRPWDDPVEIKRSLMPNNDRSPREELFCDVVLRLEKTTPSKALMYPFESLDSAQAAARSVAGLFARRVGKQCVEVKSGFDPDGRPVLYVARGPKYVK